jgi:hypothetical protein
VKVLDFDGYLADRFAKDERRASVFSIVIVIVIVIVFY